MSENTIKIHTDGSCLGNPGPGGFGIIIDVDGETQSFGGGEIHTTNNRMEMTAVLTAIRIAKSMMPGTSTNQEIAIHSDSKYVVDAFNRDWISGWQAKNWRNAQRKEVKNRDLWEEMIKEVEPLNVTFHWVCGHSGDPRNEACDRIANEWAHNQMTLKEGPGHKYPNSAGEKQPLESHGAESDGAKVEEMETLRKIHEMRSPWADRSSWLENSLVEQVQNANHAEERPAEERSTAEETARTLGYEAAVNEIRQYLTVLQAGLPLESGAFMDGYVECRGDALKFLNRMKGDVLSF